MNIPPWPECEECDSGRSGKPLIGVLLIMNLVFWAAVGIAACLFWSEI